MTARPMLKVSQGALTQPSEQATALALTAEPGTFPTESYGLAMWLDAARNQALEEVARSVEADPLAAGHVKKRIATAIRALGSQNDVHG